MSHRVKKTVVQMCGGGFIVVGVAGLVLPLVQGVLFIAIGLYLLSVYSESVRRKLESFKLRYPKTAPAFAYAEKVRERFFST